MTMKKVICLFLSACLLFACVLPAFAEEAPHYVVLGDSIAQGYGVYNRGDAA